MTEQQFTQRIEGLVNDFQNDESTRKELFDGIMDVCINLAKPLQLTIEEQSNLLNRQIEQNERLNAKHERLVSGLKGLKPFDATVMETDGTSATFNTAVVVYNSHIKRLLTESEDTK